MNKQKAVSIFLLGFFSIVTILICVFAWLGRYISFDEPTFSANIFWFLTISQVLLLGAGILGVQKLGSSTRTGFWYTVLAIGFIFFEVIIIIFSLAQS